jgi:hypothetical protein
LRSVSILDLLYFAPWVGLGFIVIVLTLSADRDNLVRKIILNSCHPWLVQIQTMFLVQFNDSIHFELRFIMFFLSGFLYEDK